MNATVQPGKQQRLAYIDWMRGFACLLMFEVHSYDSWLGGSTRDSQFMKWSQLSGTIPAPLFLFLAGVSIALVSGKMREKGIGANQIARRTILRGAEILGLGLLFRVQEYVLGIPWAPWTDLLRVDILNTIGISIMLMGIVGRLTRTRVANIAVALVATTGIAFATPFLYTTWRPRWLPWYLETYINGVHIYDSPRPWLFPIFPWAGFAFAGLALGYLLFSEWGKKNLLQVVAACGLGGVGLYYLSNWLDARALQLYPDYDYWHTSPNFFLARVAIILVIVFASYVWCRWGLGQVGFSPMIQMGQTSLLVYWVHIEFVYGRFSILKKEGESIPMATLGFLIITAAMVLLSLARTGWTDHRAEILAWFKRKSGLGAQD
ncbi:MAG TPA: heparan-alpha-glucosaminide N-acetyltransferase domain-containing protein [Candidatus Acidoferrales bacterium]|nr:heparan-alpha-glucosaminide N-acetyltransferase domain-containing protein [Candidatus Acidoferrales bacterium]